jgi:hypothetical protein
MRLQSSGFHMWPSLEPQIWLTIETDGPVHSIPPQTPASAPLTATDPQHWRCVTACVVQWRTIAPLESSTHNGQEERARSRVDVEPTTRGLVCLYASSHCRAPDEARSWAQASRDPTAPKKRYTPPAVCARRSSHRPSPCACQNQPTGSAPPGGSTHARPAQATPVERPRSALDEGVAGYSSAHRRTTPCPTPPRDECRAWSSPAPGRHTPHPAAPLATAPDDVATA